MGSSGSLCCKTHCSFLPSSFGGLPNSGCSFKPSQPPRRTGRAIPTSYAGRSSGIAQQPRGFRQPVRFARRGCGSLPTSRNPVCERHLLSCRKGIIADPSRREKSAYTYKLINRRRSHTIWDCKYHLIWVTKYHYPILVGDVSQRARELLREIARTNEMTIYGGAINRDHVHILISIPPQLSVSRAVQFLKGKSRTSPGASSNRRRGQSDWSSSTRPV
jgi:REP element-mobilizing transposase RayT